MTEGDLLQRAADALGLERGYLDAWGTPRAVPEETQRLIVAALGVDPIVQGSIDAVEDAAWRRIVEPVCVVRADRPPFEVTVALPADLAAGRLAWTVTAEDGTAHAGEAVAAELPMAASRIVAGRAYQRRRLVLAADLASGYHRLGVGLSDGRWGEALLVVSPGVAHLPPALATGGRCWGVGLQLYGLRSRRNWGIGDFTDLARLARPLARLGCDAIALNPLHALFPGYPEQASPYAPTSRRFANALYIDVEAVDELRHDDAARRHVAAPAFQAALEALRATALVDYGGVARAKRPVLEMLYGAFVRRHRGRGTPRERRFERYRAARGEPLVLFAAFEALAEHFGGEAGPDYRWRDWPEAYRDPRGAAVEDFVRTHADRVAYHQYVQWIADDQLSRAARACERAGMAVGLYQDLAVGFESSGADAWSDQALLVEGFEIGAPPDPLNLKGQSWGVAPYHPQRLREAGYGPLIETLRANMRHGGALRVDHVLGLARLYWVPRGRDGTEGGYVENRLEELLAVIALESVRNRCLVIGEDLGTVPPGFRERLAEAGLLSYRLVYFERDPDGGPLPAEAYPRLALAAIGTHDLPTLAGFWTESDIDLRERLDLFPLPEMADDERIERTHDRRALVDLLVREGLVADGEIDPDADAPPPGALVEALYAHLARSPSMLVVVHPGDALGATDPVNVPGTVDEHPNWRRKLAVPREAFARNRALKALFARLRAERPRR